MISKNVSAMLCESFRKALKLAKIAGNRLYLKALVRGVAAGVEHEKLLRHLACEMVVDIGANRGQFSLVARNCCPNSRIVSFEPLISPSEKFVSIFSNDKNTVLMRFAIGPAVSTVHMHVSAQDDSSSILPIGKLQETVFPGTNEVRTEVIDVVSLDRQLIATDIASPALLKIDVQGYEMEVLKGCESLLSRFDYVYCECSFIELYEGQALADSIIDWLLDRGFNLAGFYNPSFDQRGISVQADLFFKKHDC